MIRHNYLLNIFYKRITDFRLRKKIFSIGTSRARYFTISTNMTPDKFSQLSSKYGSDKDCLEGVESPYSWPAHTYGTFYEFLFHNRRESIRYVFECGIGSNNLAVASNMGNKGKPGASLRLWLEYFPFCEIYAGDIDPQALISEDRIQSFQIDQTDPESIQNYWKQIPNIEFDLMVDDGLHNVNAGMTLLTNSINKLAPGGFYIIEDVSVNDLEAYSVLLMSKNISHYFVSLHRDKEFGFDNNLIVITHTNE